MAGDSGQTASEAKSAGDEVTVHLYRTPREIENTIVAIGSHDLILDLLGQFLADPVPGADEEVRAVVTAGNPRPLLAIGLGGWAIILWLMMFKPF